MLGTSSGVVSFACRTKEVKEIWIEELEKVISNLDSNYFSFDNVEDETKVCFFKIFFNNHFTNFL